MADLGAIGVSPPQFVKVATVTNSGASTFVPSVRFRPLTADASVFCPSKRVRGMVPEVVVNRSYSGFRRLPSYLAAGESSMTTDLGGTIRGITKQEGAPVGNRKVRLYYRATGLMVFETVSAADGSFAFYDCAVQKDHYVIGLDDTTDQLQYNAVVIDLLKPNKE